MNEVIQGAKYRTIKDVKDVVKVWAISLRKEFRVLKSSSKEVLITIDGRVFCRCQKPKVHHLPCSYVIAACSVSGLDAASYVSHYFTKEAAAQTWCHEIYGIGILGPFTPKTSHPMQGWLLAGLL